MTPARHLHPEQLMILHRMNEDLECCHCFPYRFWALSDRLTVFTNSKQKVSKTFFKKSPTVLNTINGGDSNTYDSVVSNYSAVSLESDWLLSIKPAKAGRVLRLMPGLGGWESSSPLFYPDTTGIEGGAQSVSATKMWVDSPHNARARSASRPASAVERVTANTVEPEPDISAACVSG